MELFLLIAGYTAVLVFCYWLGEHLQNRRRMASRREAAGNCSPAPAPPRREAPPQTDASDSAPLEPEVLPDPRQAAQALARDLERLARRLGLDAEEFRAAIFSGAGGSAVKEDYIDLEEKDPAP